MDLNQNTEPSNSPDPFNINNSEVLSRSIFARLIHNKPLMLAMAGALLLVIGLILWWAGGRHSSPSTATNNPSNSPSISPTVPPANTASLAAPTNLTAKVSGAKVTLTWKHTDTGNGLRFEVFRNRTLLRKNIDGLTLVDTGVKPGSTYVYRVRAVMGSTVSSLSGSAKAKIPGSSSSSSSSGNTPNTSDPNSENPSSPSHTSSCPLPKYPVASCTGVPAGTNLQTISGNYTATTTNQVIDAKHITGTLTVRAHGVVIKNSQIDGAVLNDSTSTRYRFTIQDSTIGKASTCNDYENGAIGVSDYTALRVRVINFPDGFRIAGSNILIQDSYVTLCSDSPAQHSDGIQAYDAAGASNITIKHNTIDQRAVTNGAATAPIFIPNDNAGQGNQNITVSVMDNLLAGGGFTLRVFGDLPFSAPAVTGNKIVENTWEYGPLDVTCGSIGAWSGNAVVSFNWTTGVITHKSALNNC